MLPAECALPSEPFNCRLVPSVNVVCAWDAVPYAVSMNRMFKSCSSGLNSVLMMFPFASAVTLTSGWVSSSGCSTSRSATDSYGCHPLPVIVTVVPGA